jgi:predicted nucleotidyltransferase
MLESLKKKHYLTENLTKNSNSHFDVIMRFCSNKKITALRYQLQNPPENPNTPAH